MNALVHIDQGNHKVKLKNATNEKNYMGFLILIKYGKF